MRRAVLWLLLVLVWVLLWDAVTPGQVVAGAVVAALVLVVVPPRAADATSAVPVRPLATLRLAGWFAVQFVLSNAQVVRAVLLPGRYVRPEVVRVELRRESATLAALVSNLCALTPGMQPVDATDDPPALDVHVLSYRGEEPVRAVIHRLEDLVLAAFGPSLAPGGAPPVAGDPDDHDPEGPRDLDPGEPGDHDPGARPPQEPS